MGWVFGDSPQSQMGILDKQLDQKEAEYNKYLEMLKGAVQGSGYDFFAPQKTSTSGTSVTNTNMNSFVRPEILPDYKKMEGMWRKILEGRLARPTGLPPGYAETSARAINETYQGADTAARNMAARRGLSGAAAYGLDMPIQSDRAGKLSDLVASLPLKARELQNEDIQLASAIAQAFGVGQRTTGSSTSTTKSNQNTIGPANIGQYLQYLGMLQPFDRPIMQPQPRQGILGPLIQTGAHFIPGYN